MKNNYISIIKILLFLLIFNSALVRNNKQDLISSIIKFEKAISNKNLPNDYSSEHQSCLEYIISLINYNIFQLFITYIDFGQNKLGKRENCGLSNGTYVIFDYRIEPNIYYENPIIREAEIFKYNIRLFSGLCIPKECHSYSEVFLDKNDTNNKVFFDYLDTKGIKRLKIIKNNQLEFESDWKKDAYIVLLVFLILYISIIILYSIFYEIFNNRLIHRQMNIYNDQSEMKSINKTESEINFSFSTEKNIFSADEKEVSSKINSYLLYMYHILSIKSLFGNIFLRDNQFYTNKDLGILSTIRFICLLFITFYYSFDTFLKLPQRDKSTIFYKSFGFAIVKLGSFMVFGYVLLEGIYLGYKLMFYIRKNSSKKGKFRFSFKELAKFLYIILSRALVFIVIFLLFYIFIIQLSYDINGNDLILYFNKMYQDSKRCFNYPLHTLLPFYYQFDNEDRLGANRFSINDSYFKFNTYQSYSCFTFFNISFNLIFSIVFTTVITFLLIKRKKGIYDKIFLFFVFFPQLFQFFYFSYIDFSNNFPLQSNISFVCGETISLDKTFLFYPIFFLGFIIGVCLFYQKDIVVNSNMYADYNKMSNESDLLMKSVISIANTSSKKSTFFNLEDNQIGSEFIENRLNQSSNSHVSDSKSSREKDNYNDVIFINTEEKTYLPYVFCFFIIRKINSLSIFWSYIIFITFLIIILLLIFSFYLYSNLFNTLIYNISLIKYIYYVYEKKIFIISFSILILMLYNIKEKKFTNNILDAKLFFIFERISFSYFCILESSVLLCFCQIEIDFLFTNMTFFLYSLSVFLISSFISILFVGFFEIPVRIMIKGEKNVKI